MTINSKDDLYALTHMWRDRTNRANAVVDDAVKDAQDHAYALGLSRGRAELVDFSQRLNAAKAADDQREWSALIDAICKVKP